MRFQFHIGSIRSMTWEQMHGQSYKFQFHIGSIRSEQTTVFRIGKCRFNSTLVRLEGCDNKNLNDEQKCFNSTLVRLEAFYYQSTVTEDS